MGASDKLNLPATPEDVLSLSQLRRQTQALSVGSFGYPAADLARRLLACVLVHKGVAGLIVETEAYLGLDDLAAHASRGKTKRTEVLFGPPGRAYVYFIYGLHACLNVVADSRGSPGCVLIRALAPLCGLHAMYRRRGWSGPPAGLANGPGKLTEALAITRAQYGRRMDCGDLTIRRWLHPPAFEVDITPRIGITACADWPLRFTWAGHPCLSRRSPRARAR